MSSLHQQSSSSSQQEYQVHKILSKKVQKNRKDNTDHIYYLIHWRGYPENEATWEPYENLDNAIEKVRDYEMKIWKNKADLDGNNDQKDQMRNEAKHYKSITQENHGSNQGKINKLKNEKSSLKTTKSELPNKNVVKKKNTMKNSHEIKLPKKMNFSKFLNLADQFDFKYQIIGAKKETITFFVKFPNGEIEAVTTDLLQKVDPLKIVQFYQKHIIAPQNKKSFQQHSSTENSKMV